MTYDEAIRALREYVDEAHEYGVAYEVVVATLEKHSFGLSGRGAVRLLETGLIMGYKTERPEDSEFDLRK
ncbi:MAG: hypothetical protein JNN07_16275 [Verrucomicrobiales bacterium]|nr:hypothetical protein [Verrucomicrobiales bacterium]